MDNSAFQGIRNLYGNNGFEKIQHTHILVVGIGGVGSWVAESLIRSGVKKLTLIDLDDICVSNINRQVHSLTSTVGKFKVDAMKERLLDINPLADIQVIASYFSEKNYQEILEYKYDFIVDAIDSVKDKSLLISEAQKRQIPIITIGAAGGRIDPTKIEIRDLNRTINDKLLFRVRKSLKKNYNYKRLHDRTYKVPAVFTTELAITNQNECDLTPEVERNCQTGFFGSVSTVTASMGFAAASYILNQITKK